MTVRDEDMVRVGPWPAGVNNVAQEGRLPTNEDGMPVALREADNVDLDPTGRPIRRRGTEQFFFGELTHSLWSVDPLPFGLFVDRGALHALHPDRTIERVGAELGNMPVSYCLINDRVLFSSHTACGMVDLDLQVWPWAPEQPSGQPGLSLAAGYGLAPGQYQVAVTFFDALRRESGSTLAAVIDVPEGYGISLDAIPLPLDPGTSGIAVYVSGANDQVLRQYAVLPPGTRSGTVHTTANGRALSTQFVEPLPAGQIVRYGSGRQFVGHGTELLWSEALRYGLFNPATNRIRFPAPIDLAEPVGDGGPGAGVFVAAGSRTYWLAGDDPAKFTQQIVRSCGVVPGSPVLVNGDVIGVESATPVLLWLARDGHFCVGMPGGQVIALKKGEAVVDDADRAAVLLREESGLSQFIAALRAPKAQSLAVSDRAVAHVIHRDPA